MSHTIVASICEGHFDCVPLCPQECIFEVRTPSCRSALIEPSKCTDCGACQFACPIDGAVLNSWQGELQVKIPDGARFNSLPRRYELPTN